MIKELCNAIEEATGRKMENNKDFEWLAKEIEGKLQTIIGLNTLKRMWGYYSDTPINTRQATLNVLSQFIGYENYQTFCLSLNPKWKSPQSNYILSNRLNVNDLEIEDAMIHLSWLPDRKLLIKHLGRCKFVVVEVENSKLSVGDTFECHLIIEGEPLYLGNLVHINKDGSTMGPLAYVAGKDGGVRFQVLE